MFVSLVSGTILFLYFVLFTIIIFFALFGTPGLENLYVTNPSRFAVFSYEVVPLQIQCIVSVT
jgi:hypothetical protein